jgi:hypothetical protein
MAKTERDPALHVVVTSMLSRTERHLQDEHGIAGPIPPSVSGRVALHLRAHGLKSDGSETQANP